MFQREDAADHRDARKRERGYGDLPAHWPAFLTGVRCRSAVGAMGVELVVPPRRTLLLGRAGSQAFHLIVERWPSGSVSIEVTGRVRGTGSPARRAVGSLFAISMCENSTRRESSASGSSPCVC